ncbi:MAG TPA: hypothetical protein VF763_10095 [Candidatus Limnocylindrales bacterium]
MSVGTWAEQALPPSEVAAGLERVRVCRLLVPAPQVRIRLAPGDRPLVSAGDAVLPGTQVAERLRDAAVLDVDLAEGRPVDEPAIEPAAEGPGPGRWWVGADVPPGRLGRRSRPRRATGELLHEVDGRWRMVAGEHRHPIEAPIAGIVREARPGIAIGLTVSGTGLPAAIGAGEPARGRLELASGPDAELRPGELDVGRAGAILVVGSRIDAELLSRARAMGIRGVIAGGIASGDLRGLAASEARQRASLHQLPPFAVLALEGHLRRPVASPVMAVLAALVGREVAIVSDPPMLLFDAPDLALPEPEPDRVRVTHGALAGREGRWAGLGGLRRFAAGVQLEAGLVRFEPGPPVAVPLADLERFG